MMCTISILPFEGGEFSLLMNRDESRERKASLDLERSHSDGGLEFAYPLDPLSGGSWIGVNSRGLALAVMNQDAPAWDAARKSRLRSRGEIVPAFLSALGSHEAAGRMARL